MSGPGNARRWIRSRPGRVTLAGALLLVVALGILGTRRRGSAAEVPVTTVQRGELAVDVTSVGELQAVRSQSFGVPRLRTSAAKIVWLVPEGSTVAPGDTLVRFDNTEVARRVEELEGRLGSARAALEKLRASQAAQRSEMEAGLADQRAVLRLAEIAADNVQYEARVQQEKAQLELQRAQLGVRQAEAKRQAEDSIEAAALAEQRVTIDQLANQLAAERDALVNHVIVAPTSGLAVYGSTWSGSRPVKIKAGDQIYFGGAVLELPDLSQLRVTSAVNEARVDQLQVGQRCDVRVDAFPDTLYHGAVSRIAALGHDLPESEGVKVFDFEVLLDGSDRRLRPGMTVTVTVHIAALHDVLFAPIEAVHLDSRGAYVLQRRGRGFERTPVVVGRQNDTHVVLVSGAGPGDVLALAAPVEEAGDD
jgi:multidrug efflux pump subunit AcrA (membrane-fusion protein)